MISMMMMMMRSLTNVCVHLVRVPGPRYSSCPTDRSQLWKLECNCRLLLPSCQCQDNSALVCLAQWGTAFFSQFSYLVLGSTGCTAQANYMKGSESDHEVFDFRSRSETKSI